MLLRDPQRESKLRRLFPPVLLLSFIWIGVQLLLQIYFRALLQVPSALGRAPGDFVTQMLTGSTATGPTLATGLLVVNILFVVLIWLKYRSIPSQGLPEKLAVWLTYGGATALLVLLQWSWGVFLRSALQLVGT